MKKAGLMVAALGVLACAGVAIQQMVASSATDAKPLGVGAELPKVKVTNLEGEKVDMKEALGGKPTVLVFYRGGWCPFCNKHLAELGQIHEDLMKMGYQIVGVSPDTVEELKKTIGKDRIPYALFSDSSADAMKAFGVAFRVDDETFTMYRDRFKIDLEKSSGGMTHHVLPVPTLYLVDKSGKITFAFSNADYKVRLDKEKILEAAKSSR